MPEITMRWGVGDVAYFYYSNKMCKGIVIGFHLQSIDNTATRIHYYLRYQGSSYNLREEQMFNFAEALQYINTKHKDELTAFAEESTTVLKEDE